MAKVLKKSILYELLIGILFISIIFSHISYGLGSTGIHLSSNGSPTFTGDYEGDLSIMYFEENWNWTTWTNQNSSTNMIRYNASYYDHEYKVRSLEIRAGNLVNYSGVGFYSIAENISNQINLTSSYSFAQEFTAPELMQINHLMIYMNYTFSGSRYIDIFIFDENFQEELGVAYYYDTELVVDDWISVYPSSNVLKPGERYNIVVKLWTPSHQYNNTFNFWKAENYSNPSFNKGATWRFDGADWIQLPNDDTIDMLCNFSYTELIDPEDIDLKFIVNNETVIPSYQITPWGFMGYEAFTIYTFNSPLSQDINLTVTSNQTIPTLDIEFVIYYFMLVNASGTYDVNENRIEWKIIYPYEEISFGWPPPIFLFESDWTFIKFSDPDNREMNEIYFGPINFYNKSYYGITIFFGPPLEEGNYTGVFHSPNYCHSINTKIKVGNNFTDQPTIELGQVIKLEAEIFSTINEPISGGIGHISFTSPTGNFTHNETALTSINGIMSTSEISVLSDFEEGLYSVFIFWTNGKEIAYFFTEILVEDPTKINGIGNQAEIFLYIGLALGIAVLSVPIALISQRLIKQRNWEKSLKNLFVLTKDGLNIYEYSFGIEIQDPALISAMISALTNFVREATGSKKALRTVDQEDKKVILNHGDQTITALMSEKDLPIIHKRVKKFTEAFESQFGLDLKSWRGETTIFKGAEIIVNKHFPIDVEEQIVRGVRQKLIEFRERLDNLQNAREIISMMREITEFISRYRTIVNEHYIDYYFEIISIAEEKITST